MKPASFETAIRLQFDTLVKRVIDCTVKNYEKELNRRSKREVLFCELPEIVVQSFAIEDEYDLIEKISFVACGIEILVQKSELSKALEKLRKSNEMFFFCPTLKNFQTKRLQN